MSDITEYVEKEFTEEETEALLDQIELHQQMQADLAKLKKDEKALRLLIVNGLFGSESIGNREMHVGGYTIKAKFGLNIKSSIIAEDLDLLNEHELNCFEEVTVVNFIESEYKALEEDQKDEIDNYITVKPSLPTLKTTSTQEEAFNE